MNKKISHR